MEAAEEVAFYGGEETEKYIIERDYFALIKHINRVLRMKFWHGIVEEGIIKYDKMIRARALNANWCLPRQVALGKPGSKSIPIVSR